MFKEVIAFSLAVLSVFSANPTPARIVSPLAQIPAPTPTSTPTPTPRPLPTVTSTPSPIPSPTQTPLPIMAPGDLENLFGRFSDEYHVDKELLKRIAKCESGFNQQIVNGDYAGIFQFASQTWITARSAMGINTDPSLRTSAEESIRTAAYKISLGQQNAWKNCL